MKTKEENRGKEEELPKKKELLSEEELLEVAAGGVGSNYECYKRCRKENIGWVCQQRCNWHPPY